MKRLWWITACCVLVGLAGLAGCGGATSAAPSSAAPSQFPLTFDNCGKKITIERPPEKLLTIGTPAVDVLHQVGASDRVVARAGEYEVPATGPAGTAVQNKPIIDAEQPSLEKILGAKADMVIGYGPGKTTAEDLAGVRIPIYVQTAYCGPHGGGTGDGGQLTDVLDDITFLGQVFGTEQQATESARGLGQRIDAVKAARPAGDRKTAAVIYFLGDARYTYGDQAIVSDQMATLGLANALGSVGQDSALNVEAFIGAKPDVVILIYGYEAGDTFEKAKQKLLAIPGVSAMKAVTSNSIVGVTGPEVEGSPIAVDGLERMARQLSGSPG
ncbi:MAG: ABC transporter substrate-binding protein [Pseudonocardiaceae bacterium]